MRACRSEGRRRRLGPLLVVALAAAGCQTRELDVRPFHLQITVAGDAAFPAPPDAIDTQVEGVATRVGPTELVLATSTHGDVRLRFDNAAAPQVVFPPGLDGAQVRARIRLLPVSPGPRGEPLPFPGVKLTDLATGSVRFALGEWSVATRDGTPAAPRSVMAEALEEDLPPALLLQREWVDYEATDCGLVYYAPMFVLLEDSRFILDRDEEATLVRGPTADPLHVRHVVSYHRSSSCAGQTRTWTQIAAWR